jgi:hypothetical protein
VQHRTKEAETKVHDLTCYSCDMFDGDDCLNINQTFSKHITLTKKCAPDELFCSVKRFSYTMSDKNSTSDKKLWTLQRNCSTTCENECIIIGERMKLHACQTCCQTNYCNVGADADTIHLFDITNIMFSFLIVIFANFSWKEWAATAFLLINVRFMHLLRLKLININSRVEFGQVIN